MNLKLSYKFSNIIYMKYSRNNPLDTLTSDKSGKKLKPSQKVKQQILVESSADYKYPENPKAISIDGKRYKVKKVISRMRTSEKETYKVELDNEEKHQISYITKVDKWILES